MYSGPTYPTPIVIPKGTQGFNIVVESGTFVMTGYTALLFLQNVVESGNALVIGPLNLTVQSDGLSGIYTTTGSEFNAFPLGWYNAELKVTQTGIILYSIQAPKAVVIQGTFG